MQVQFSRIEGEFPYKADYIGFSTPPVCPRLGLGGAIGHSTKTYGKLLDSVLKDLRGCTEQIEPVFSDNIGIEIQKATRRALRLLEQNNSLESKLNDVRKIVLA
jgi:hypothetical protein